MMIDDYYKKFVSRVRDGSYGAHDAHGTYGARDTRDPHTDSLTACNCQMEDCIECNLSTEHDPDLDDPEPKEYISRAPTLLTQDKPTYQDQQIYYFKRKMHESIKKLCLISPSIETSAINSFIKFKETNKNRANINVALMALFLKKAALDQSIEITNKRLCMAFDIDLKHLGKANHIFMKMGLKNDVNIEKLKLNYIASQFSILNLPIEYQTVAQVLVLFVTNHIADLCAKYINNSIASWVTYYIIIYCDLFPEIRKKHPETYHSKIKCLFDTQKNTILDKPGSSGHGPREHIVSNVNLSKIDKVMAVHKPKLNRIIDIILADPTLKKEKRLEIEEIVL